MSDVGEYAPGAFHRASIVVHPADANGDVAPLRRIVGDLTGVPIPADRVGGTVGANVAALERGAMLFRVHDVKMNRDALDVAWAIMSTEE